eukprot:3121921-Amphidinium_carterae.1
MHAGVLCDTQRQTSGRRYPSRCVEVAVEHGHGHRGATPLRKVIGQSHIVFVYLSASLDC